MQGFLHPLPHLHWRGPSGGFGSRCCWASRCRIQSDAAPDPSGRVRLTETPAPPAASTTPRQPARTRSCAGWPRCGWTSRPGPGPGLSLCRVSSPQMKNSERLKWRGGEFSRRSVGQWEATIVTLPPIGPRPLHLQPLLERTASLKPHYVVLSDNLFLISSIYKQQRDCECCWHWHSAP